MTEAPLFDGIMTGTALFDGEFRYVLTRDWNHDLKRIAWIGLNPSTATADTFDATMRRVYDFSRRWGFGGFTMLNLHALRSTDPRALTRHDAPTGPENDRHILEACTAPSCGCVVAAWGNWGRLRNRGAEVKAMLEKHGIEVWCLGISHERHPVHPLYIPADRKLVRFL